MYLKIGIGVPYRIGYYIGFLLRNTSKDRNRDSIQDEISLSFRPAYSFDQPIFLAILSTVITTEPGLTAFFSNVQTYDLMTGEERKTADHSWVEYTPHPYMSMGDCKANLTGLCLIRQGKEKKLEELGEWNDKDVKRYPMVWVNLVTREKAFMVHGICMRRAFFRSSEDEEPRVVEDLIQIC